ncbi:hypothetical protein TrLO_g12303 [Triparma laevis f. longispina]|uniref:Fe2OG dioxygenase domain-containing protein n=1 Tax=Triparma laevis f. longispina TaxID=1714387 RepID=A0A9W7KYF1_9STRA|nr:hypothetical protein TrLO_g12303 [Triparma laevis f. longispina]
MAAASLTLPQHHPLSLSLAASPSGSWTSSAPGLAEISIEPDSRSPYSCKTWLCLVGGAGLGADEDVLFGGDPRRPVCVRVLGVEMSHPGIDDLGCVVDAKFWAAVLKDDEVTLALIEKHLRILLSVEAETADGSTPSDLTKQKVGTITKFRNLKPANNSAILASTATLNPDHCHPDLSAFLSSPTTASLDFISSPTPGVYTFELFPPPFCAELVAIIDAFEATTLPRRRPNTMNNYGLVLTEIGLEAYATSLLERIIAPLSARLWPEEVFSTSLDAHHTFCVEYRAEELGKGDRNLDMHHDASEVTLNVCLGRGEFSASGLRFCGEFGKADHRQSKLQLQHSLGRAVLHLGRHRHGADDIASGERVNLIVWARSSAFRAAAAYGHVNPDGYPKKPESGEVHQVCLSKANDADYEARVKITETDTTTLAKRKYTPFSAPPKSCAKF